MSSNHTKGVISPMKRMSFVKRRRHKANDEKASTDESNINNFNKGYRYSLVNRNKNLNTVHIKNSNSNIIDSKSSNNNDKDQNKKITQKKLDFNFYQKLICLNCCECWQRCGSKKNDYELFEKGMKYISELLEIKNIMKKICIDNMKYSLDYNELKRQKMEEMSVPILSLDQTGRNVPLSYFEGNTEHEKIGEVVDVGRD